MAEVTGQSNGTTVARNTTYLTGALIGQKVLSFLYALILFRLLGISISGDYLSALSFVALFSIFLDFGLTQAFIRQTARDAQAGVWQLRQILTFKLTMALVVVAALFGTIAVLDAFGRSHPDLIFLKWAAAIMVIDSLTLTSYGYLRGIQRLEYESIGTLLHRVMVMIVGITGLVLGLPPVITIIAVFAGSTANLLYATFHLWRRGITWRPTWSWVRLRPMLLTALPFGLAGLFVAIYSSSDNILLSIFSGRRAVGIYGLGFKIMAAFQILPAALVAAVYPAMSAAFVQQHDRLVNIFRNSVKYLMVISLPVSVALFVLAKDIVLIGWTRVWLEAVWPLRILVIGLPFIFLNFPVGYLLNAANKQTRNTVNIGIAMLFNLALNIIFIQLYSYKVVAINSTISSILLVSLGLFAARRIVTLPWRELFIMISKIIVASLAMGVIGALVIPAEPTLIRIILAAAVMAVFYLLVIFSFRIVKVNDLKQVLQRFR